MRSVLFPTALFLSLFAIQCQVGRSPSAGGMDVAEPGTLSVSEIQTMLRAPGAHETFVPEAPLGLPEDLSAFIPADNPMTPAKVELGRQLYFDKRLSRDGTVSCATCHDPSKGWTDNAPVSTGIRGQKGTRSAPTVMNRILGKSQFWDGRAASLEEQALGPIENPIEMGFTHEEAVERLNAIPGYRMQFEAVFGGPATPDRIAKAIAAFERTVLVGGAKNDYYEQALAWQDWDPEDEDDPEWRAKGLAILRAAKEHAMSESALRGRELFFGKASCSTCHFGPDFTDEQFHNLGVGMDRPDPDVGRMAVTGKEEDYGKFKTPGLRNVHLTAPYMHDGSLPTLLDVVKHYNQGGIPNKNLSENIFPLNLSEQEMLDLVAFMEEGLASELPPVTVPRLP